MNFGMNPGPYYRSKRSTTGIMMELMIGLAIIWICAVVFNFMKASIDGAFAIINPIIAMVTAIVTEALFLLPKAIKNKTPVKDFLLDLYQSYGYVSGMILALLLPAATSWYAIVISTIIAVGVGKMLFGGFGHNIFNPAILGRIVCQVCFLDKMEYSHVITTGATITTTMGSNGWSLDILNTGHISLTDLLLGNHYGAMGETFTLAILIVGIIFVIRKVIDWRAPVFYLATIYVTTFIMGLCGGYGVDAFEYALVQISLGGVMFGAIFCLTDPVTSPTSRAGRVFFGIGAALITMLIRYCASAPEGVAYSILFMNMFTPLIDLSIKGLSKDFFKRKMITLSVMGAVAICGGLYLGFSKVDKMGFYNYQYSFADQTGEFTTTINYLSEKDGIETYEVNVSAYIASNTSYEYGSAFDVFANLDAYQEKKDQIAVSNDGKSLILTEEEKETTIFTLKNEVRDGKWVLVDTVSNYYLPTDVDSNEGIYSLEMDDDFNIVFTLADDHTSWNESEMSFASMNFNVDIDYENKLVVDTKLNSSGAGGGYGDAMLDYDNVDTSSSLPFDTKMKLYQFYKKYIEVDQPVSFDEFAKYDTNSALIDNVSDDIKVGATYTSNGFMYMMNRVIEYANYYHQSLNDGKVVKNHE